MDQTASVPETKSAAPPAPVTSRKRLFVLLAVLLLIVLGTGSFAVYRAKIASRRCFQHSFGQNCEYPAKDGGKRCVINSECSSGLCIYGASDGSGAQLFGGGLPGARSGRMPTEDHGYCDTYEGDNDGVEICHRPKADGPLYCYMQISRSAAARRFALR